MFIIPTPGVDTSVKPEKDLSFVKVDLKAIYASKSAKRHTTHPFNSKTLVLKTPSDDKPEFLQVLAYLKFHNSFFNVSHERRAYLQWSHIVFDKGKLLHMSNEGMLYKDPLLGRNSWGLIDFNGVKGDSKDNNSPYIPINISLTVGREDSVTSTTQHIGSKITFEAEGGGEVKGVGVKGKYIREGKQVIKIIQETPPKPVHTVHFRLLLQPNRYDPDVIIEEIGGSMEYTIYAYFKTKSTRINLDVLGLKLYDLDYNDNGGKDLEFTLTGLASRLGDSKDNMDLADGRINAVLKHIKYILPQATVHKPRNLGEIKGLNDGMDPNDNSQAYRAVEIKCHQALF